MATNAVIIDNIAGISIKSFREIRQAIATSFTEVFGASINLEPSSPDGMLVDLLAYLYTELAQALQTIGANMDVSTASGTFLDMLAAIAGLSRNEGESDASLRNRMETATFDGLATPDAMLTYLRQNITEGVSFKENSEDVTVGEIPAHRFIVYVPISFNVQAIDPSDSDWQAIVADSGREDTVENFIAQKIWNCKPAGIKAYGSSTGLARDLASELQQIAFSFILSISYAVNVTITEYDEEELPADFANIIAQILEDWAKKEFTSGKDIIPQRMCAPIYDGITGVDSITVSVATVSTPQEWTTSRVHIPEDKVVSITKEHITVTLGN